MIELTENILQRFTYTQLVLQSAGCWHLKLHSTSERIKALGIPAQGINYESLVIRLLSPLVSGAGSLIALPTTYHVKVGQLTQSSP